MELLIATLAAVFLDGYLRPENAAKDAENWSKTHKKT